MDPNGNLALNTGWYAVEGQITAHSLTMSGPVSLILKDGSSLTLKADVNDTDSTCLIDGGMLTVYGQKEQTGYILSRGASAHLDDLYLYGCSIDIQDRNGTSGAANKLEVEKQLIIRKGKLSCGSAKVNSLNYNGGVFAAPYGLDVQSCEPLRWESTKDYFMFKATGDLKDFSVYDGYAFVDIKGNKFTGSFSSEDVASLPSGSKKLEASLLHSYGKPEWNWSEDYKRATAVMTCKDCGEVLEIEAKVYAEEQGNRLTVHTAHFELFGKDYENTVTTPTKYKIIMNVGKGGTASANVKTAQYNDTVAISVSPDEGYTVKSVRAVESSGEELDVYKLKDGKYEFSVDISDISVYVEFTEGGYHAMQEPYVNEQGEYILGCREHYEDDDGTCYYVYKDKSPRYDYVMEDVSLSYFIFQDNDDGTLRISRYTGPVTEDMTLEIPETFNGKKITVLGGGDSTNTLSDTLFISGDPVTIHLSKNITELKKSVFNRVKLKEVSGDTSGLRKISDYAFYKKSDNNYTTDIYLDYIGEIENDENGTWGRYQSSTTHLSHATTFKYINRRLSASVVFSFNDDHLYGEPAWQWSDDFSSAVLKVSCTHPLCRHTEEVNALVTSGVSNGIPYYVASAILDETTYTCIYQPAFEPFINENGEYIPGAAEHFKSDGKNYAVNDDGTLGDVLDSVDISYFDFKLINNDSEYQINYYTGPTDTLTELVIPKTFSGKPVTVLGSDINASDNEKSRFVPADTPDFKLVLNENVTEITPYSFSGVKVTDVTGDTSGLSRIGDYAFSQANSAHANALDIRLDHSGTIANGKAVFNGMNVTARIGHKTAFSNNSLGEQSINYILNGDHTYGEPVWTWSDDNNSASVKLVCTDTRCRHEETANATVSKTEYIDKTVCTAAVEIEGKTYTDSKELAKPMYNLTVESSEHGTVTADKESVYAGEEVTLSITPDTGYELTALEVKDDNITPAIK